MRTTPAQATGGRTSAEKLIRHAHNLLAGNDIALSPSKVSRLVQEFRRKVERAPERPFDAYMVDAIREIREYRTNLAAGQVLAPEGKGPGQVRHAGRRVTAVDRQTGEPATWNVFVQRDLPRLAGGDSA